MGLLNRIALFFDDRHTSATGSAVGDTPTINPATGLPMTGGVDVAGNPFGTDLSSYHHDHWQHDPHRSGSPFDDHHTGWHDPHRSGSPFDDHHTGWHDPFTNGMGGGHDPWRD